jgi:transcriptional antiterminator RfaH
MPSYWACARVQPQREAYAAEHIERAGFQLFLPKVETGRTVEPLFRSYCFILIIDRWRQIETTFGVLSLIRFGDCPAKVPEREIAALRDRADATGIIRLPPPPPPKPRRVFRKGEKVRVVAFGSTSTRSTPA